jgi:type I restriction enzyme S subunit
MSRLDELINEFCPDGVEYKAICEFCKVGTGKSNRQDADENGEYPFYVRSKEVFLNNSYEFDEEAIIIPGEGSIGEIFHYVNGKYALHQRAYRIHIEDNYVITKFLYYYMAQNFKKFIYQKAVNATVKSIRKPMIEKFVVPIPPLPVQREIVRILDNFTELTAELTARKKQYEYYQNILLTCDGFNIEPVDKKLGKEIQWLTLGEVCTLKAGKTISSTEIFHEPFGKYQYPCFGGNGLRGYVKSYNQEGNFSLIGRQGALCGNVCYASGKFYATEHAVVVEPKGKCDERFLYYILIAANLNQYKTAGAQPGLSVAKLEKVLVLIPSMSAQKRIVDILDRFDALCNDITIGLPAEIEARQKQYEYYRDKLLSFKEKK